MQEVDTKKRRLLLIATSLAGGIGVAGAAAPFVASMLPSERAKAAGAPVEADVGRLAPGELRIVTWRGQPVWILRRTKAMLSELSGNDAMVSDPHSEVPQQPDYARNEYRSIKPEIAVLVGVCTHLGCSPVFKPADDKAEMGQAWNGGFYCPCHGSKFDLAGRVIRGSPAPTNLVVPPYEFVSDEKIVIGSDRRTT
jgi:ubiquinol-cytochrome c reductase iron-sulfur subunit